MVKKDYKKTDEDMIPGEWDIFKLSELLEIIRNGTSDKQNSYNIGIPVTRIETISDGTIDYNKVGYVDTDKDLSRYKLLDGDILFSHINSISHIGKVAQYNNKKILYHGMNLLLLRFKKSLVDKKFILYRLKSRDAKSFFERYAKQAVNQASLNQYDVGLYQFPLPPLPEQEKIASILSTVDEKIEKIDQIIEKTKELKKGLMQQLLTKGIGHSEFKEVRIGVKKYRIPNKWEIKQLGDLVEIKSGYSPSKFNLKDEAKYPFIKVNDLNFAYKYINKSALYFNNTRFKLIKKGTIIFPKRGAAIATNKVNILSCDSFYDTNIMGLITKERLENEYLFYFILHLGLWQFADTTSIPQINNKHIKPISIPLPPLEEQKEIAEILSTIDKKIQKKEEEKEKIETLKKGLMQKLLTGQVRVKV